MYIRSTRCNVKIVEYDTTSLCHYYNVYQIILTLCETWTKDESTKYGFKI